MSFLFLYGLISTDMDKSPFSEDFLSCIRKKYFENNLRQSGKTTQTIQNVTISYKYCIEQGKPLKWKAASDKIILQRNEKLADGKYAVNFYDSIGNLVKRNYYSSKHTLLKVNYYNSSYGSEPVCVLEIRKSGKELVILKYNLSSKDPMMLYAYSAGSNNVLSKVFSGNPLVEACALTNQGIVYFGTEEQKKAFDALVDSAKEELAVENVPVSFIDDEDRETGFAFDPKSFNIKRNLNETFDITKACDFGEENYIEKEDTYKKDDSDIVQEDLSDMQKLERIDDIDENQEENTNNNQTTEIDADSELNNIIEAVEAIEDFSKEPFEYEVAEEISEEDEVHRIIETLESTEQNEDIFIEADSEDSEYSVVDNKDPDIVISGRDEKYLYFGEISNNKRNGYGRTAQLNGRTVYDGNYADNKKEGFGTYYLKDGRICYVGHWKDNKCSGVGVGFNSKDGSILLGNWENNSPVGIGAKFTETGKLKYISYDCSDNKSTQVTFIDKDNLCISVYNPKTDDYDYKLINLRNI